jgi:conjugative transfer signal peptidase TraF
VSMRTQSRVAPLVLTIAGLASLTWAAWAAPSPRVIYNASGSVPIGWYRVRPPTGLRVGSIVLARLPAIPSALAAQRGYLPIGVPLLKRIGAIAPQRVCVSDRSVRIDDVPVAATLSTDGAGRRLLAWPQCRRLRAGELFLLSLTNPASFDSRYFGPVQASYVIGQAEPIWTRP